MVLFWWYHLKMFESSSVSKLCFSCWIEYKLISTMQNVFFFFFFKWSFFFQALRNAIFIIFGFPECILFRNVSFLKNYKALYLVSLPPELGGQERAFHQLVFFFPPLSFQGCEWRSHCSCCHLALHCKYKWKSLYEESFHAESNDFWKKIEFWTVGRSSDAFQMLLGLLKIY